MARYLKFKDQRPPGAYEVFTVTKDPATGARSRLLFFQANQMIARVERKEDIEYLMVRYPRHFEVLDPSEVPDGIKAVLDKRASKAQAVEAADKTPPKRAPKKNGKGG